MTYKYFPASIIITLILLVQAKAFADFELPILHPVSKTVSVPEDVSIDQLQRLLKVRDLKIEIRMRRGNMLSNRLLKNLTNELYKFKKRIVLKKDLRPVHVERLRELDKLEVQYNSGNESLKRQTLNALYELGPVRKTIVLGNKFTEDQLKAICRIKYVNLAFQIDKNFFSNQQLNLLAAEKSHQKIFFVPYDFDPNKLYDLLSISPLKLIVQTNNNQVNTDLLAVLRDLKTVEITIVANGKMTLDNARQWTKLKRFSLKLYFDKSMEMIPGLGKVLNRIAPP